MIGFDGVGDGFGGGWCKGDGGGWCVGDKGRWRTTGRVSFEVVFQPEVALVSVKRLLDGLVVGGIFWVRAEF